MLSTYSLPEFFDSCSVSFVTFNVDNNTFTSVNDTFCSLVGYDREVLLSNKLDFFISKDALSHQQERIKNISKNEFDKKERFESRFIHGITGKLVVVTWYSHFGNMLKNKTDISSFGISFKEVTNGLENQQIIDKLLSLTNSLKQNKKS